VNKYLKAKVRKLLAMCLVSLWCLHLPQCLLVTKLFVRVRQTKFKVYESNCVQYTGGGGQFDRKAGEL